MQPNPLTINAADIAAALGRSERWLKNNRRALELKHGFPAKLPGGAMWSRAAIETWLATYGKTETEKAAARADLVAAQKAVLEAAYGVAA